MKTIVRKIFGGVKILLSAYVMSMIFLNGVGNAPKTEASSLYDFPVQKVSKLECRKIRWDQLTENCKIDTPSIGIDYQKFADQKIYKDIYTVLWGGSYDAGRNVEAGAHPGIDIASSEGTPVYAVSDGEIVDSKWNVGYGNFIRLRFKYGFETVYATYGHLSEVMIKAGDQVKKGQMIGKIGNSGRVMGQFGGFHLHFEINRDVKGRSVYSFEGCSQAWQGELVVINKGYCRDEMKKNTIDPLQLRGLASVEQTDSVDSVDVGGTEQEPSVSESDIKIDTPELQKPDYRWEQLPSDSNNPLIKQFLLQRNVFVSVPNKSEIKLGTKQIFTIRIEHKDTKEPFNGVLPVSMMFYTSKSSVRLTNATVWYVKEGVINVEAGGNSLGASQINFVWGTSKFYEIPTVVIS